jgi:hypothetical protein
MPVWVEVVGSATTSMGNLAVAELKRRLNYGARAGFVRHPGPTIQYGASVTGSGHCVVAKMGFE